ncbi:MAG: hypothetical protein QGG85_00185 [Candidatus Marinimicrobia bacterium]|nr:hypothetical protein [Candidatus Neomarinimicrobiota bacterium]
MAYKYFGYFLAVLIIVPGSVISWILWMLRREKSIMKKFGVLLEGEEENG